MQILRSYPELKTCRTQITGKLGLVPTMGALHEGHLALVRKMRELADAVMVSIFVNPTQFGPSEDFNKYPRNIESDLEKLEGLADYVYLPQVKDIYPNGEKMTVKAGEAAQGLESDFRPGHFDGVATVVSILFDQTKPDLAIFGEKDYQQLMVIKELNSSVGILGLPTIREPDGLALSSRNVYLSAEERKVAPLLYKTLTEIRHPGPVPGSGSSSTDSGSSAKIPAQGRDDAIRKLEAAGFKVQYVAEHWGRLLVAVYLGKTRLIDNIPLNN